MTAEPRDVEEIATPDPDREWFVAGVEGDDEHPWWIWSFTQCAAGDECDHDECKPVPVVALHAPADGDRFDVEERLANWIVAAHNDADRLAAADRENAELRGEVERHEVFMRAIKDCRDDPARAIAQNDIINGKAIIAAHIAEAERDDLRAQLAAAQAQLAEEIAWRNRLTDRLEAVRAPLAELVRLKDGPRDDTYRAVKEAAWDAARAALSAAPQPEPDGLLLAALPTHLAYISRTVTASYPEGMNPELVMRRRVGKVFVESGELADAIEGYTGENPRKGVYAKREDVVKELIDCASASLCAVEHMTGDRGDALEMLAAQVAGNAQRLSESIPDRCVDEPSPSDNWRAADAQQRRREDIDMAAFFNPQPPASDEPARCEHDPRCSLNGAAAAGCHCVWHNGRHMACYPSCHAGGGCVEGFPGPAASGAPDGGS